MRRLKGNNPRLLIVSWDGATFGVLKPFIENGFMPNLTQLMNKGISGPLKSVSPPVTPVAWASFMTGMNPGKHGIFDFRTYDPATRKDTFTNATHIRCSTLWEILSNADLRVGVIGLPMTYPPYPVNGFLISGFDAPSQELAFSYPEELRKNLPKGFPMYSQTMSLSSNPSRSNRHFQNFTRAVRAAFRQQTEVVLSLIKQYETDVLLVHYQELDMLQHGAWPYIDPEISQYNSPIRRSEVTKCFRELDACLGKIIKYFRSPNDNILVISDHGFGPLYGFINPNNLLKEWGFLTLCLAKDDKNLKQRLKESLKDSRFGLVRKHYRILKLISGWMHKYFSASANWIERKQALDLDTEVLIDWDRTLAIVPMAELYGFLYLCDSKNVEKKELLTRLIERFSSVTIPQNNEPLFSQVITGREFYVDKLSTVELPDIILIPKPGWAVYRSVSEENAICRLDKVTGGTHRLDGVLIANGNAFKHTSLKDVAQIIDLAPTILHILDLPVPADMDGRILSEILSTNRPIKYCKATKQETKRTQVHDLSEREVRIVKKRLRSIGYLE